MILVDDKLIDTRLLTEHFECDLASCRGACCTFPGGAGAPLLENEITILENLYPKIKHLLPEEHNHVIENHGVAEQLNENWYLRCHEGAACVFVMYSDGVARCAIHEAWQQGIVEWPKPISCHLFPMRVDRNKRERLRFEDFPECAPALRKGRSTGMRVLDFIAEGTSRAFGNGFREALRNTSDQIIRSKS
jgi:hypothetical protein